MSSSNESTDCCARGSGVGRPDNPPGQPALSARLGTWATFYDAMVARLPHYALPDGDYEDTRPLVNLTTADGLPDDRVRAVAVDGDGNKWVATPLGAMVYAGR